MNSREILKAILLGSIFAGLWLLLMFLRVPMETPAWWYPALGKNSASAILWMQIEHSVNLLIAGLPVAIAIAYNFPSNWKIATLFVALVPAIVMAYDIFTGFFVVMPTEAHEIEISHIFSSSVDFIKIWVFLFVLVYVARGLWPTNKSSKRDAVSGAPS